jgi:hypothetical protein
MQDRLGLLTTIVIGALGWLITHYVDRLTEAPTVEYSISSKSEGKGGNYRHVFRFRNVNRLKAYGPLKLTFQAPDSPIRAYALRPVEPGSEGEEFQRISSDAAEFNIPKLMPNGAIKVIFRTEGKPRPAVSVESGSDIRLTRSGFETWLVRHEITVMGALIVIWITALGGIIYAHKGHQDSPGG